MGGFRRFAILADIHSNLLFGHIPVDLRSLARRQLLLEAAVQRNGSELALCGTKATLGSVALAPLHAG